MEQTTQSPEVQKKKQSESISKLATALAKAQGQMTNAEKDGQGTYGKYATLAATWDVIRKPLSDNEIAVIQRIKMRGEKPFMSTMLIHSSGEFLDDCELELKFDSSGRMNAMQAMGSAVTYARRYCLQAVTGVAPFDDDDGAGSGDPKENKQPTKTNQKAQGSQDKKAPVKNHAPGADQADPADFIIPFGQTTKGKKVRELPEAKLIEIYEFSKKEFAAGKQEYSATINHIGAFLASVGSTAVKK